MVGGRMAQRQRTMSSWKMYHWLVERSGLMGQYGRESAIMYAVQAIPRVRRSWHQPSASRGFTVRDTHDPPTLPIASPIRNTARMMENTYTVAPSIIPMRRVHTTSAPSAHAPDTAIVT